MTIVVGGSGVPVGVYSVCSMLAGDSGYSMVGNAQLFVGQCFSSAPHICAHILYVPVAYVSGFTPAVLLPLVPQLLTIQGSSLNVSSHAVVLQFGGTGCPSYPPNAQTVYPLTVSNAGTSTMLVASVQLLPGRYSVCVQLEPGTSFNPVSSDFLIIREFILYIYSLF